MKGAAHFSGTARVDKEPPAAGVQEKSVEVLNMCGGNSTTVPFGLDKPVLAVDDDLAIKAAVTALGGIAHHG